jgi:FkbM family methyltransferase
MFEIASRMGVEFIVRQDSVDVPSIDWTADSLFMSTAAGWGLTADDVILDFGGHVGSFSLPLAARHGCRAVMFEPDQESLRLARASALLNGLEGRVHGLACGLGGRDGRVQLFQSDENWGHTIVEGGGEWNRLTGTSTEIEVLSLATAIDRAVALTGPLGPGGRLFVKVNIEGAEFDLFEQASPEALARVQAWVGEMHLDLGRRPDFESCRVPLEAVGCTVAFVPPHEWRPILVARQG